MQKAALRLEWRILPSRARSACCWCGSGSLGPQCSIHRDGAITFAISVLSALEGLKLPAFSVAPFIWPLAVLVPLALFAFQHRGTLANGKFFGP